MKQTIALIKWMCCILIMINISAEAQVTNENIKTTVSIKDKVSPRKLNKWNLQPQKLEFGGEFVIFENQLHKIYLQRNKSKGKKKSAKKSTSKAVLTKAQLTGTKQNLSSYNFSRAGGDCGEGISEDICNNIKNAMRIEEIPEEEPPRDCPDEHCLPLNIHKKSQYFVVSKLINFKAVFYNKKGKQIGTIGKAYSIKNDENYVAYPIKLQANTGDMFVKVFKYGDNVKEVYKMPITMKDF